MASATIRRAVAGAGERRTGTRRAARPCRSPSCAKQEEASIDASKLKTIRDRVVKRFPTLRTTLDQAFHTALDLEELELGNIYRRLLALTTDDSRMSSTFRTALGQYSHHEERLLAAIEEHGKDPSLLERAIQARKRLVRRGAADSRVRVSKA